jgi:hypothetical protein
MPPQTPQTGQFRRIHIDENRGYQACGLFSKCAVTEASAARLKLRALFL